MGPDQMEALVEGHNQVEFPDKDGDIRKRFEEMRERMIAEKRAEKAQQEEEDG